jgi:hypothetical protein
MTEVNHLEITVMASGLAPISDTLPRMVKVILISGILIRQPVPPEYWAVMVAVKNSRLFHLIHGQGLAL